MKDDPIAELRTKAEQLVAIGDHVKNQWRASEWQRTQCLDNAPLVAKALLLALEQARILRTHCQATGKICASCKKFEAQLAALVKGES